MICERDRSADVPSVVQNYSVLSAKGKKNKCNCRFWDPNKKQIQRGRFYRAGRRKRKRGREGGKESRDGTVSAALTSRNLGGPDDRAKCSGGRRDWFRDNSSSEVELAWKTNLLLCLGIYLCGKKKKTKPGPGPWLPLVFARRGWLSFFFFFFKLHRL